MTILEALLNRRWILKARDKELYYQVRDQLAPVKKFLAEKMGYQMVVNQYLIKVEKMPAKAQPWMGIQEFNDRLQYVFLCMILMFLEDKETEEQFMLSALTEYIQGHYKEAEIDWTSYTNRRHLVKVMKFCVSCGMIEGDYGNEEDFAKNDSGEVLYENTGTSRYFMKRFTRNIMDYTKPEDFGEDEWIDINTDRGVARRQRVYRKLLMSMGMYLEGEVDEDFAYVKNYRNVIGGELAEMLDCELQVHKTSAYLVMGENGNLGRCFPEERTLSDMVLLCNQLIQEEIRTGRLPLPVDEQIRLSGEDFRALIESCKKRYGQGFIKTYREMTTKDFYQEVRDYMEQMDLIEDGGDWVLIRPIVGKIMGKYPEDYTCQEDGENV